MAKFKFECPHCRAEVSIRQGVFYECVCGWQGRYPTAREQLVLTPGDSPIDVGARRAV